MKGTAVVELLRRLGEGESIAIDGVVWMNVGDRFVVKDTKDDIIGILDVEKFDVAFDGDGEYEVCP